MEIVKLIKHGEDSRSQFKAGQMDGSTALRGGRGGLSQPGHHVGRRYQIYFTEITKEPLFFVFFVSFGE